jgi:hypothetical protein
MAAQEMNMDSIVNTRSQNRTRACVLAFTLLVALGWTTQARADRVVVVSPAGSATEELRDDVEDRIAEVIRALGHETVSPPNATDAIGERSLETSEELGEFARTANARFVVVTSIEPLPGQYRLLTRVFYTDLARVEELVVNVTLADERMQLNDILACMVRPSGLGDDAVRLGGGASFDPVDTAGTGLTEEERRLLEAAGEAELEAEAEAERLAALEEEAAQAERDRLALEEEAALAAEEEANSESEAWSDRERYGTNGDIMVQAGFYGAGILTSGSQLANGGGFVGTLQLRAAYAITSLPGFELRGGIDAVLGSTSGIGFLGGGAFLASLFSDTPIFIGGHIEFGINVATSGNKGASFVTRLGPVASWRATDSIHLELAPLDFTIISSNGGGLLLGSSLRLGYRF